MNQHLRRDVEWSQNDHPEFGNLYRLLMHVRNAFLEVALHDWRDRFQHDDIPLLSLEAMPPDHRAGQWRGKFMEIGPLGFSNVISFNLMMFRHAGEIPPVLAHEMAHWWDRPNTGHGDSFWKTMHDRFGHDRNGLHNMTWIRLEEYLPMDDLREITLNPNDHASDSVD